MNDQKHFFIEQDGTGKFIAKTRGGEAVSEAFDTQEQALEYAKRENPNDHPDVERVRNTHDGGRDQWRSARHQ